MCIVNPTAIMMPRFARSAVSRLASAAPSSSASTTLLARPSLFARRSVSSTPWRREEEEAAVVPLPPAAGSEAQDPTVVRLVDEITALNMMQVSELVGELRERLDLPADAYGGGMPMMAMPGLAGGGAAAEPAAEEKTEFDVKLVGFDDKAKIKVIKEVRAVTGLGLKEAKAAVESGAHTLKEGISKADAEALKEQVEAVGGKVELE